MAQGQSGTAPSRMGRGLVRAAGEPPATKGPQVCAPRASSPSQGSNQTLTPGVSLHLPQGEGQGPAEDPLGWTKGSWPRLPRPFLTKTQETIFQRNRMFPKGNNSQSHQKRPGSIQELLEALGSDIKPILELPPILERSQGHRR